MQETNRSSSSGDERWSSEKRMQVEMNSPGSGSRRRFSCDIRCDAGSAAMFGSPIFLLYFLLSRLEISENSSEYCLRSNKFLRKFVAKDEYQQCQQQCQQHPKNSVFFNRPSSAGAGVSATVAAPDWPPMAAPKFPSQAPPNSLGVSCCCCRSVPAAAPRRLLSHSSSTSESRRLLSRPVPLLSHFLLPPTPFSDSALKAATRHSRLSRRCPFSLLSSTLLLFFSSLLFTQRAVSPPALHLRFGFGAHSLASPPHSAHIRKATTAAAAASANAAAAPSATAPAGAPAVHGLALPLAAAALCLDNILLPQLVQSPSSPQPPASSLLSPFPSTRACAPARVDFWYFGLEPRRSSCVSSSVRLVCPRARVAALTDRGHVQPRAGLPFNQQPAALSQSLYPRFPKAGSVAVSLKAQDALTPSSAIRSIALSRPGPLAHL